MSGHSEMQAISTVKEAADCDVDYGPVMQANDVKKIRVLQLGSPSGLYGAERWILAMIKSLPTDLYDIWVGSVKDVPNDQVQLCDEAKAAGFKTKIFESYGKFNISSVQLVRQFIENNEIHILHSHGYKTDIISVLATKGTACKVVTTPHGWTKKPSIKLFCYELIDRLLFPFCDAVVPLSKTMAAPLRLIPGLTNKLHLIQNGVDISEIEAIGTVAKEMRQWKGEGVFIAGYIGRLITGKGIETLLSALMAPEMNNWRLAIIGDGERGEELNALSHRLGLGNRVIFFGFRPDRLTFLKGFDAFVLPSESEGIPRCLMEAMAARVPVVASDIPGCRYLVDDKRTGLLFEVNNSGDLGKALNSLVSNPQFAQKLVNAAYDHVRTFYSSSRMAKEYSQLYQHLLADSIFQTG